MQRFINLGMIITLAAVMAAATEDHIYPAVFCVLGIVGLTGRFEFKLKPTKRVIIILLITLYFSIKYRYHFQSERDTGNFPITPQWITLGQYFLAMMTTCLFLPSGKNMSPSLPLLGLAGILCIGQKLTNSKSNINLIYQLLGLFYILLATIYFASSRKTIPQFKPANNSLRHSFAIIILTAILTCGWVSGHYLYIFQSEVQNAINRMGISPETFSNLLSETPSSSHFSDNSTLSSVANMKIQRPKQVAINVFSNSPPGYLRAKAMANYANSKWTSATQHVVKTKTDTLPKNLTIGQTGNIFIINNTPSKKWHVFDIWPSPKIEGALFTPQNSSVFRGSVEEVFLLDNDIITAEGYLVGLNYSAAVPQTLPPDTLTQSERDKHLFLPKNLDPKIYQLANDIFTNCTTAREKMDRIKDYFHTNYEYHLGIKIPTGIDPLSHFLLASPHPAAHCEYFASGAAILLRMAKVPTRYVTGYVTSEKNPYTNSWVARNQDAHAWVEAWDDQNSQWILVEATSGAGVPAETSISKADQFIDYLKFRLQELRVALSRNGLKGLGSWLWQRLNNLVKLILTTWGGLVFITAIMLYALQKLWRSVRNSTAANKNTPDKTIIAMHSLLNEMDHRVKKQNHHRLPTETLHQFATQIQTIAIEKSSEPLKATANWYLHYARILYSSQIKPEDLIQLKDRMQNIKKKGNAI